MHVHRGVSTVDFVVVACHIPVSENLEYLPLLQEVVAAVEEVLPHVYAVSSLVDASDLGNGRI